MHIGQSTIWKNSVFVFFSQVIRLVTNFLIFIGIARLYGPVSLGQFSISFAVANLCLVLADFGFDVLLTTEVAQNQNNAKTIIQKYFTLKLVFVTISALVMAVIPAFKSFSETSTFLIFLLVPYVVFTSFTNFVYAIFRGFEKFDNETKISFYNNAILLILMFVAGLLDANISYLILMFVLAKFIGAVLCITKLNSLIGYGVFTLNLEGWKKTAGQVLIFGFHYLFGNLFFKLDTILIGIWIGDEATGIYQSSFRIILLLLLIPDILRSSVLPVASRLFSSDLSKWEQINKLVGKILLYMSIPMTLFVFVFSEIIISFAYGIELYAAAVPILQMLSVLIIIRFYAEPYGLMITTSNRQHIRMIIAFIATLLSFVLNYFLIPLYGLSGAAYAAVLVNLIVACLYFVFNLNYFLTWIIEVRTIIILMFSLVITFVIWYFNSGPIFSGILLLGLLIPILLLGLSREEINIFKKLVLKSI